MRGRPTLLRHDWRPGEEPALLCVHGLGCDRHSFAGALSAPALAGRALVLPDLVGFGESPATEERGFTLGEQASRLVELCESLGVRRLAILGHSMGGAVGILVAETWPGELVCFVNAVGNLVPEDCFFSRQFIAADEESFTRAGFSQFEGAITRQLARTGRLESSSFPHALAATTPRAVYHSARDLVWLSDHGELLQRFINLPCPKLLLQDQDNPLAATTAKALADHRIAVEVIADTGHGLMEDNPPAFYGAVARFVGSAELTAHRS